MQGGSAQMRLLGWYLYQYFGARGVVVSPGIRPKLASEPASRACHA